MAARPHIDFIIIFFIKTQLKKLVSDGREFEETEKAKNR